MDTVKIVTDENIKECTEQEAKAFIKDLVKRSKGIYRKFANAAFDNIERAKAFAAYIEKYPGLFADHLDYVECDFFKWTLRESITQTQLLLDKIQQTEDELGLPVIHKY